MGNHNKIEFSNPDNFSKKELKELIELSKLKKTDLESLLKKNKVDLKNLKDQLVEEKNRYVNRVEKKYKYKSSKEKKQALNYVPGKIDKILKELDFIINERIRQVSTTQKPKQVKASEQLPKQVKTLKASAKLKAKTDKQTKTVEITPEQKKEIIKYFQFSGEELNNLENKLQQNGLNLDIAKFLNSYKVFIETNLKGLKKEYKDKIKLSIKDKALKLSSVVDDRIAFVDEKIKDGDYKKEDRAKEIRNQRWIINAKMQELFSDMNNKILPSVEVYLKYKDKVAKGYKFLMHDETLYNVTDKIKETEKMLNSDVLKNGDFDKTWKSFEIMDSFTNNWDIFDASMEHATFTNGGIDGDFLKRKKIKVMKGETLLSKEDIEIEKNAQAFYIAYAMVSVIPYIGLAASIPSDVVDTFSDQEGVITILKKLGFVDKNYTMEKSYWDNILGGIGLIITIASAVFGAQGLGQGKKIMEAGTMIDKVGIGRVENAMAILGKKLGISEDKLNKTMNEIKNIEKKPGKSVKLSEQKIVKSDLKDNNVKNYKKEEVNTKHFKEKDNLTGIDKEISDLENEIKVIDEKVRNVTDQLKGRNGYKKPNLEEEKKKLAKESIKLQQEKIKLEKELNELKKQKKENLNNFKGNKDEKLNKENDVNSNEKINKNKEAKNDIQDLVKNFDKLPKSKRTENIIKEYPELKPVEGIEIDGQKFLFSEKINDGHYEYVIGYVEKDGKYVPRLFYKSRSDGGWRGTPGVYNEFNHMGRFSKGEMFKYENKDYSYVVTTKSSDELNNLLDKLTKNQSEIGVYMDIIKGKYFGVYKDGEKPKDGYSTWVENFMYETKSYDDKGVLSEFKKVKPGHLDEIEQLKKAQNLKEVTDFFKSFDDKFPEGFIPIFSKGPIKSFEMEHTIAGKTKVDVFEGELNGQKIEWYMAQAENNPAQVWIWNIRLKDAKINTFGVDDTFINSGVLNLKPFEYPEQLPKSMKIKAEEKFNKYYDITPFLSHLKPIREYIDYLKKQGRYVSNHTNYTKKAA